MSIELLTKGLMKRNGIWYSEKKITISYPDDGNDICFQLEDHSFWFEHRKKCIVELIKRFSANRLFFDIGGGNGFVAKAIEEAGIATVLIEPGESGCINARNRKLNNVICATLEDAGFEKESIPAAGVFDVVEHIENDSKLLCSINDYLIKGGLLYITVPAYNFLWSNKDSDSGHYNRYTLSSLSKKLDAAGFNIEYATYIFSILPIPILLIRTIPSKLGFYKNHNDTNKNYDEHQKENPILEKVWAWELKRIKANKTIPFGGSCLVVARKR